LIVKETLADTFIDPALEFITEHGGTVAIGARLKRLIFDGQAVTALEFDDGQKAIAATDQVIVATPSAIAERLIPGLETPAADEPIVNAHFATSDPPGTPLEVAAIVGGAAQWVFRRPGLTSVTVSAARGMVEEAAETLAPRLWADVVRAFPALGQTMPPYRIVKEKRATIRQSPDDEAMRAVATTAFSNLWLAGDWTRTGLPATIEGSILSGFKAARLARSAGLRRG
jgi:phytoene dehydrogenase-like protein